jgi:hypothetical protein
LLQSAKSKQMDDGKENSIIWVINQRFYKGRTDS